MSGSARVDVLQDDKGLLTCFEAARVEPDWAAAFASFHKIESLDDFIYRLNGKDWENDLKDLLNQVDKLKDNILSSFKAAYESGIAAIRHSQAQPKVDDNADMCCRMPPSNQLPTVSPDAMASLSIPNWTHRIP